MSDAESGHSEQGRLVLPTFGAIEPERVERVLALDDLFALI